LISRCHAGAGDSVVETQHPNPAARKNVMHRGIVNWIGWGFVVMLQVGNACHIFKMAVKRPGLRHARKLRRRQFETLLQKAAGAARVDQKTHLQAYRLPQARAAKFNKITLELRTIERNMIKIFCSLADRFIDEKMVYVSAEPMCIADFVAR